MNRLLVILIALSPAFASDGAEEAASSGARGAADAKRIATALHELERRTSEVSTQRALGIEPRIAFASDRGVGVLAGLPPSEGSGANTSDCWTIDAAGVAHPTAYRALLDPSNFISPKLRALLVRAALPVERIWECGIVRDRGSEPVMADIDERLHRAIRDASPREFYAFAASQGYGRGWNSLGITLILARPDLAMTCFRTAIDCGHEEAIQNLTGFMCRAEKHRQVFEMWETLSPRIRIQAVTNFVTAGINVLRDAVLSDEPDEDFVRRVYTKTAEIFAAGLQEKPVARGLQLLWETQPVLHTLFREKETIDRFFALASETRGALDDSGLIFGGVGLLDGSSHREDGAE